MDLLNSNLCCLSLSIVFLVISVVAFLISLILSLKISFILACLVSALKRSILSRENINNTDAIPDIIVASTTDHGSPMPNLLMSASIPIPQIAITLPPKILIMASPFCAGVICLDCSPNRIFPACTKTLIPSLISLKICLNTLTKRLINPSIKDEIKPLTKSHALLPQKDKDKTFSNT